MSDFGKEEIMCSAGKSCVHHPVRRMISPSDHIIQALLNDEQYLIVSECASNNPFWGY